MGQTALQQSLDLELFEGPFDLLLTLVLRQEIDLFELPLADLIEQSLGEVGEGRWDPETTGELAVLLAATVELKLRRLLGDDDDVEPDEDALEARQRLAARLIAYAPFQRAGEWLRSRAGAASGSRYRRVPLPGPIEARPAAEDPARLPVALAPLLVAPERPSLAHLAGRRVNMPEVLARLRQALGLGRALSFDRLIEGAGPLDEGMTLVAALELARRGEVSLEQPVAFGDITIIPAS
jgi:segregation and condensation protein A